MQEKLPNPEIPALVVQLEFRKLVGKETWVANHTRPDIAFAVGMMQRYLPVSIDEHLKAGTQVTRCLQSTNV